MPHERRRHLTAVLEHLAKLSPLVGLLGHRQVGKTTLLEAISRHYLSLDDETHVNAANSDPKAFVAAHRFLGTAIDECQLSPKLFPALKERVRLDKRPGQFYLSGSVRFTSKKMIQESLTGRIMSVELLPMTLSELDRQPLPEHLSRLFRVRRWEDSGFGILGAREHGRRMRLIEQYEVRGGLPGACFIRQEKLRALKLMQQLETILDRDLRQVQATTLTLPDLLRYVRRLADNDGDPIQYQALKRATGITPPTQKKLLFALEATFILRHVPLEGDFHGSALFFEDHAEASVLAQTPITPDRRWEGLVYRNLREQVFYQLGENVSFFQYRTRGGARVPFAIRSAESTLGFIPLLGAPTRMAIAAAQSFLRKYVNGRVILITDENTLRVIDDRTLLVPATQILFPG